MYIFNVTYNVFKKAADLLKIYYFSENDNISAGCGNSDFIYYCVIFGSDITDFNSNYLSSSVQVFARDDILASITIDNLNTNQAKYDILDNFIYIGVSRSLSLDNENKWDISRLTLVDGVATEKKRAEPKQAWSNRTSLTYR